VTHFFLDCLAFGEVESLAIRVREMAAPSAVWLVSEFAIPPGWPGRVIAEPLIAGLYVAFRWLTGLTVRSLPDYGLAFRNAGFIRQQSRAWLGGLLVSEVWRIGASGFGEDTETGT
jgi:hypothetical protein